MRTVAIEALNRINGDPQRGVAPDPTYTLTRAAQDMADYIAKFGAPVAPAPAAAAAPVKRARPQRLRRRIAQRRTPSASRPAIVRQPRCRA